RSAPQSQKTTQPPPGANQRCQSDQPASGEPTPSHAPWSLPFHSGSSVSNYAGQVAPITFSGGTVQRSENQNATADTARTPMVTQNQKVNRDLRGVKFDFTGRTIGRTVNLRTGTRPARYSDRRSRNCC